jgi:hypothetical protein
MFLFLPFFAILSWVQLYSTNLIFHDLTFMWPCCIVTNFFLTKPTRCTNFTNLFCHETTCFGEFVCPSSGVYSLYTQQWYMLLLEICLQTCMTYTIAERTVNKLLMMDRRTVWNT